MNYPVFIEVELTNRCNLNCVMCPTQYMTRVKEDMDILLVKKIADESKDKTKNCYLHQIGEPLLYPLLTSAIIMMHDAGIHTSLSTNAMLLTEDRSSMLLESKLDEISLCLDSIDKNNYESIRRGANFETVYNNIRKFIFLKNKTNSTIRTIVQMIEMKENREECEEFKKVFTGRALIKPFSTFAGKINNLAAEPPRRYKCNKVNTHLTIQSNGNAVVCCRDFNGISVMGNVKDQSICEIWNSDKYNEFRKNFRESELCKDC